MAQGEVLIARPGRGGVVRWLLFSRPDGVVTANTLSDVVVALREVSREVEQGRHAAGFISYDAAPAFDSALKARRHPSLPLLWFGLYRQPRVLRSLPPGNRAGSSALEIGARLLEWHPSESPEAFAESLRRIRAHIAAGDTYQVNYSFRLRANVSPEVCPYSLFVALCQAQPGARAVWVDAGDHVIASVSPELFFLLEGDRVVCRPMKGTAPRGRTTAEDEAAMARLRSSAKERAENIMIVDMMRNDLGRVARPGSVTVQSLCEVERYDTVLQMTSTVAARTDADWPSLFAALFPCASVTGAPKPRTMQIIAELESEARGIYTGCAGYMAPGRQGVFNVCIRTVHLDRMRGLAEYGTGAGITWDSRPDAEWDECRTKALVLAPARPRFDLLETMRWTPARGYFLLEAHLNRLKDSADYFGFPVSMGRVRRALEQAAERFPKEALRVRMTVDREGRCHIESVPLARRERRIWRVALTREPIQSFDRVLFHKTTFRAAYEKARAAWPDHDDVLLWNERGEVTESTVANLLWRRDGIWHTPALSCGLLPGVFRGRLLAKGWVREAVIEVNALDAADRLLLVNSVRGFIPVALDRRTLP